MGYYDDYNDVSLDDLISRTITEIKGAEKGDSEVRIICEDGSEYRMMHHQDCCESVYLEDIVGDINDLIGSPIVVSEESTENGPCDYDSCTWTFYRFATQKGWVYLRWYGSSNGYYGEGVSFEKLKGSGVEKVNGVLPVKDTNWPENWEVVR